MHTNLNEMNLTFRQRCQPQNTRNKLNPNEMRRMQAKVRETNANQKHTNQLKGFKCEWTVNRIGRDKRNFVIFSSRFFFHNRMWHSELGA